MDQPLILDRYRPLEELGEGGFGSVVLAWDTRMQRRVAIKRMPLMLDASGRASNPPGLAEARTAAMLSHPAIVTVHDFDTDDDEAFLILEHVEGGTLADILHEAGGPLSLDAAAAVLGPVFDAVEHAHANGVLHLDLKPENVLIDLDGRVKVADFGVAALSTAAGHGAASGGTLGHAPIEQLEGGRTSERTDVWSLGVLAYEVLTGENPLAADTFEEAVTRIEVEELPPPSAYEPLPEAIDDAIIAALGPYQSDRYRTVADFADALMPHLGDPDIGRDELAELVEAFAGEVEEAEEVGRLGLWDRAGRWGALLTRILAAALGAWLAYSGLSATGLDRPALLAAADLVALAAAIAPAVGALLGVGALAIGVGAAGAPLAAAILAVAAAGYWWLASRRSAAAALVPLAAPPLAAVNLAPLVPLLAGFALPPAAAAGAGLAGAWLALLATIAAAHDPASLAGDPRVLGELARAVGATRWPPLAELAPVAAILSVTWPLAAVVMSLASRRASRPWAALGAVFASGVLWLAEAAIALERGTSVTSLSPVPVAVSLILMLAVVALGAPTRAEQDRLPPRADRREV